MDLEEFCMPAHEFQSKHDLKKNKTCLAACTPVLEPKIGQFMPLNSELCFVLARPGGGEVSGEYMLTIESRFLPVRGWMSFIQGRTFFLIKMLLL